MRGVQRSFTPPVSGTTDEDQDRRTPSPLVSHLAVRFGRGWFDLDAACSADNCVVCRLCSAPNSCGRSHPANSLADDWMGRVFCNPPWNSIEPFIRKARREVDAGHADVVVFLVPARTTMPWFIWATSNGFRMYPISGRVRYENGGPNPFEHSIVLVYDRPVEAGDFR